MLQTEFTYKRILLITLPLMIGTFVQAIVTITDAIFVSNLGEIWRWDGYISKGKQSSSTKAVLEQLKNRNQDEKIT